MKKFFRNFYLLLIFLFLYAPIAVLMLYSFNDSKSRRIWHGFTTDRKSTRLNSSHSL